MATRAFPQNVGRLVARSTIVYTADDIRRVTTQCLADGTPCTLELGANIIAPAGFTIPGGLKAFSVDGAQRFKIIVSGDLPFLFHAKGAENNDGCPVDISNVEVLVKPGSTLTTAFVLEQFNIDFAVADYIPTMSINNVVIDASDLTATCTNVFGHGSFFGSGATRTARVLVHNLFCSGVGNLLALDDNLAQYISSTVDGFLSLSTGKPNMTLGQGAASARFTGVIENVLGEIDVSIGDNSTVAFIVVQTDSYTGNNGDNTLLRVIASPRSVGPNEVDLDNISGGGGGGATVKAATITVPFGLQEQTVNVVDASCTAASNVIVGWGSTAPTDENQPGACAVTFSAVPAAGSLDVTVSSNNADPVGGAYKILYTLG
jgi:hypothetical protein